MPTSQRVVTVEYAEFGGEVGGGLEHLVHRDFSRWCACLPARDANRVENVGELPSRVRAQIGI